MELTLGHALQLYAPFVGLTALAFWMGVLSQRVRQLEKDSKPATMTELNIRMGSVEKDITTINHTLQGMNRQLANIAMNRVGQAFEILPPGGPAE